MTKPRWWNVLAGVEGFVRMYGWWPSAREIAGYLRAGVKPGQIARDLKALKDDPVPLLRYERRGWRVTDEGWRVLEREPVAARYAFRQKALPARVKRKRNGLVREAAHAVFEGRGEDTPIVE